MSDMTAKKRIRRAIIPVAGKGTRLLPLTLITPKEMLPLGRKPVLEHIVDEVVACGIREILFIISTEKGAVMEYFGKRGDIRASSVIQPEQKGLGDAVLWGKEFADEEPFAVVLGDSVISTKQGGTPLQRLLDAYEQTDAAGVILVQDTPPEEAHRYGMVRAKEQDSGPRSEPFEISDLVEKPSPEETPGRYAIAGRYVFDGRIFDYIERTKPGTGGEIQLTDAIRLMLADGHPVWCVPLKADEIRRDIGTFESYFEAFVLACLEDPECGQMIENLLKQGVGK